MVTQPLSENVTASQDAQFRYGSKKRDFWFGFLYGFIVLAVVLGLGFVGLNLLPYQMTAAAYLLTGVVSLALVLVAVISAIRGDSWRFVSIGFLVSYLALPLLIFGSCLVIVFTMLSGI